MKRRDFLKSCGAAAVAPVPEKQPDTLESLAAEFGWELGKAGIETSSERYTHKFQFLERAGITCAPITIEMLGKKMPLREQFVVLTAEKNAWAEFNKQDNLDLDRIIEEDERRIKMS